MSLLWALELEGSLDVAEAIVRGALERKESRGSHFRTDVRKRDDDQWLKHTIAHYKPEGAQLSTADVQLGIFEVQERKY